MHLLHHLPCEHWRKSTRSGEQGACVEVATVGHNVMARDSKDPVGPVLLFGRAEWQAFVHGVRDGSYDR